VFDKAKDCGYASKKEERIRELQEKREELGAQCDKAESETRESLEAEETKVKAAACQPVTGKPTAKPRKPTMLCRQRNRAECPQCTYPSTPAHHSQALIAVCQDCGLHHPVVADACQLQGKAQQLPVTDGTVEGKSAIVLQDTECFTVVVRRSLVPDEKLTSQEEDCILIDKTVRRVPVARILV